MDELAVVEIRVFIADEEVHTVESIDVYHGPWTLWTLIDQANTAMKAVLSV